MEINFLNQTYDLYGSFGRKLLHQDVNELYYTFLTFDTDESGDIIRYFLTNELYESQVELDRRIKNQGIDVIICYYDDIDIKDYEKELEHIHNLISNKDILGLKQFESNYYYSLFD